MFAKVNKFAHLKQNPFNFYHFVCPSYLLRSRSSKVLNSLPLSGAHKETTARGIAAAALWRWLHLLQNNRLLFSSRNSPNFGGQMRCCPPEGRSCPSQGLVRKMDEVGPPPSPSFSHNSSPSPYLLKDSPPRMLELSCFLQFVVEHFSR